MEHDAARLLHRQHQPLAGVRRAGIEHRAAAPASAAGGLRPARPCAGLHGRRAHGGGLGSRDEGANAWRELGNIPMLADGPGSLAIGAFPVGDPMRRSSTPRRVPQRSISNYWGESYNLGTLGTLRRRGNVSEGMQMIRDSMLLAEQANSRWTPAPRPSFPSSTAVRRYGVCLPHRPPVAERRGKHAVSQQRACPRLYAAAGDFDQPPGLDGTTFDNLPVESMSVYSAIIADNLAAPPRTDNYDEAPSITGRMIDHMQDGPTHFPAGPVAGRKLLLALERLNDAHEALLQARRKPRRCGRGAAVGILLSLADVEAA